MHAKPKLAAALAAGTLFSSLAFAQVPETGAESLADRLAPPVPLSSDDWVAVSDTDGRTIGAAAGYKAYFDRGSVDVIPVLGDRAPRNQPLRLRLESIRRGGTLIHEAAPANRAPRGALRGDVVSYARGTDIVERYHVRSDGVEQSFVFARPLAGSGDLVVRLAIDTEMVAPAGDRQHTMDFRATDLGGVHIGAVTGIDATGARTPGHLNFDGGHLELVLPGAFVDRAAYPLVLDPLIGGFDSLGISFDDFDSDLAYNLANDVWMGTFELRASATDYDVFAQRVDANGQKLGGVISIANGAGLQYKASIGNCAAQNRFLICWQDDSGASADIYGRSVDASTGTPDGIVPVEVNAAEDTDPDVGGNETSSLNLPVVFRQSTTGIRCNVFQVIPSQPCCYGVVKGVTVYDRTTGFNPVICKNGGPTQSYFVAWEETDLVCLRAIDAAGNFLSAGGCVGPTGAGKPDVAGDGNDFLLVYEADDSTGFKDVHSLVPLVPADPTSLISVRDRKILEGDLNDGEGDPTVAYLGGGKFGVAFTDTDGADTNIYAVTTELDGTRCGNEWLVGQVFTDNEHTMPASASKASGGHTSSDEALISWNLEFKASAQHLIRYQRYEAIGAGGPIFDLGGGCSAGGTAAANGPFALGNNSFQWTLTGADPTAPRALLSMGLGGAFFPCGGCEFTLPVRTFSVPLSGGNGSLSVPIPCDPQLVGGSLEVQFWPVFTQTSPCPSLRQVNTSNRLLCTVGN
ncbi:MAG: hypothetical protein AAF628_23675 [Planctomycetota bacterium]